MHSDLPTQMPPQRDGGGSPDAPPSAKEPPLSGARDKRSAILLAVAAAVLIIGSAIAVRRLWTHQATAVAADLKRRDVDVGRGAVVRTTKVTSSEAVRHISLLGETRPYAVVTLYAKVSGYLQTVRFDVGDHVNAGDIVATIESPETDRALLGAKADYDNKAATASRVAQLLERKYVSPQEADEARAQAAVAEQRMAALSEQQAYETLKAPLAGTVTARFADAGALMQNAASSQTSALPVVTIAETDSLRVLIFLDQADAAFVHRGARAVISMTERPEIRITGIVARVSGELDPKTRKMLVEVDVGDHDGAIVPGSFVQVQVDVPTASHPQAPGEALTVRAGQTMVALVGADGVIHFRPVAVLSNDGRVIIFESGVAVGDRVALNIGSGIADGARVRIDSTEAGRGGPVAPKSK